MPSYFGTLREWLLNNILGLKLLNMKNIAFILLLILSIIPKSKAQEFPVEFKVNNSRIVLSLTDSTDFPDYYPDQSTRDSISRKYGNFHQRARAIEQHYLKILNPGIEIKENEIEVSLSNKKKISLAPVERTEEVEYNYDYYFSDLNLILFRVQWYEGNNYILFNKRNGKKTYILGLPYFSPSKSYLIAINEDIVAGYSRNGFQLFELGKQNSLKLTWQYEPKKWGPVNIKWINEKNLIIKCYALEITNDEMKGKYFYLRLQIK